MTQAEVVPEAVGAGIPGDDGLVMLARLLLERFEPRLQKPAVFPMHDAGLFEIRLE